MPANALVVIAGYRYDSPAVIGAEPLPSLDDLTLDGTPGSRMPHLWTTPGTSRLDLVDGFTLLTGTKADGWRTAGEGSVSELREAHNRLLCR